MFRRLGSSRLARGRRIAAATEVTPGSAARRSIVFAWNAAFSAYGP
jgi:hypothetical protein